MKKIWFVVMILILIIGLAWGLESFHAESQAQGQDLIHAGQNALIDQKYVRAENRLQQEVNVDPNRRDAKLLLSRVQDYLSGNRYFRNDQLNLAVAKYRQASRSSLPVLRKRSYQRIHLINGLESKAVHYNQVYNQAVIDNHQKKFRKSNQELSIFSNGSELRLSYFKVLKLSAYKLKRSNDHVALSSQVERNCFPELSLAAGNQIVYQSAEGIVTAKKEIKAAGIDVHKMNPRMILNITKQAKRHHTSIYRYAKKNY